MILCIGTTPAAQRVMVFRQLAMNAVNRAVATFDGAAGKSINVAKVLKVLGEKPVATGFLGGDRGEYIRAVLKSKGIVADFVTVPARTRQCITVIEQETGRQTELVEEGQPVESADFEKLMAVIQRRIRSARAIVLSGTIAPGGPADFCYECAALAQKQGALSIVDAQGNALREALAAKPALVKPNLLELEATFGRQLTDEATVTQIMKDLHLRGAQRVVVTAADRPTLAYDGQRFWRITPPEITLVNPIGSGDAFTAGLAWRLVKGNDLGEACRWATAAGTANALTLMPGDLNLADVESLAQKTRLEQI